MRQIGVLIMSFGLLSCGGDGEGEEAWRTQDAARYADAWQSNDASPQDAAPPPDGPLPDAPPSRDGGLDATPAAQADAAQADAALPDAALPDAMVDAGPTPDLSLRLTRSAALGFCPQPNTARDVLIEREGNRLYLQGNLFAAGQPGSAGCLQGVTEGCILDYAFPATALPPVEATRLERLIAALPPRVCEERGDCDACLAMALRVNGEDLSPDCCGALNPEFATAAAALIHKVDALATDIALASPHTVRFRRLAGDGFCVAPGQLYAGTLIPNEQGVILFTGQSLRSALEGETCLPEGGDACWATAPIAPIPIGPSHRNELHNLVSALGAPLCEEDPELECDPCVVYELEVDGVMHDPDCCGEQPEGYSRSVLSLIQFLDDLP